MSDLLQRMKQGTKAFKLVPSPWDPAIQVAVRVLSQAQHSETTFETEDYFKGRKIDVSLTTSAEWENEHAVRILYKALMDPKDNTPIANTIMEFRNLMTHADIKYFLDEMLAWESENSPLTENLSSDELDRIVEDLKKKPEETAGSVTSLQIARKLLLTMGNLLATSRKHSG